jgi:hypothetical protein
MVRNASKPYFCRSNVLRSSHVLSGSGLVSSLGDRVINTDLATHHDEITSGLESLGGLIDVGEIQERVTLGITGAAILDQNDSVNGGMLAKFGLDVVFAGAVVESENTENVGGLGLGRNRRTRLCMKR